MKNIFRQPHVACVVALLFAAGCGKEPPRQSTVGHDLQSPRVALCEPGQPGGRLTLAVTGAPGTFNPLLSDSRASEQVIRLLFSPLVAMDYSTQQLEPALAESWSVAPDGKTWTFKLRPGLRWSDGEPLTAADVVFTWNEVMFNPAVNAYGPELFQINGHNPVVSKVDDQTVRMVTPEVFAPFLELFGGVLILPQHTFGPSVQQRQFFSAYGLQTRAERIVGSGPFRLKEHEPGKFVRLERNPEYWTVDKQKRRLPYLDEITLLACGPGAATMLFLNGQADLLEHTKPEDFLILKPSAATGKFNLLELGPGTERDFLWFNLNTNRDAFGKPLVAPAKLDWFQNKKFRQAISCAIDRDRLVREIHGGRGLAVHTLVIAEDGHWNNPNVPRFSFDPSRARALLAEIGIQDRDGDGTLEDAAGAKITFTLHSNTGNPARERSALSITEDLKKIGLNVDHKSVHFTNLVDLINVTGNYDCILMGLGSGGSDPAAQIYVLKSSGPMHQWFPNQKTPAYEWEARLDALMDTQMATLDFAARKKLFDEAQMILAEEMPMIHTTAAFHFAAARPDLGNLRPSVFAANRLTWNIEELYFKTATATNR